MRRRGRTLEAVLRLSAVLAGLVLAGCGRGADPAPLAQAQLDTVRIPDISALAGKIQETFKTVKLTGYPRVSPVRQAPVSAFGDWLVCLRSDADNDARVYALLIANNDIVDYRLALIIDGCERERFAPLPAASAYR
ncbi:MAG TPA: hypothetical protein VIY51_12125 [Xanthobacteraceae bacterium]